VIDRKNKLLVVDAMACEIFHASPRKLSHHTTNPHNKTPVPPVKSEIGNVSGTLRYERLLLQGCHTVVHPQRCMVSDSL